MMAAKSKSGTESNGPLFHLAFPVVDLDATRVFYRDVLGCGEGRSAETWVDFDFYGHQISAHLRPSEAQMAKTNPVDGDDVPVRHFGLILHWDEWHSFENRLRSKGVRFLIEPHIRFKGEVGEQATMFFLDPSGNAIEIKSFKDLGQVFAVKEC